MTEIVGNNNVDHKKSSTNLLMNLKKSLTNEVNSITTLGVNKKLHKNNQINVVVKDKNGTVVALQKILKENEILISKDKLINMRKITVEDNQMKNEVLQEGPSTNETATDWAPSSNFT